MKFDAVERIADAILYEGYVLYPYRASSIKNHMRWQFGVIAPRPSGGRDGEPWFTQTECLVEPAASPRLGIRLRCLRPRLADNASDRPWLTGAPVAIDLDELDLVTAPVARETSLDVGGVAARVSIDVSPVAPLLKIRIRVENVEPWQPAFGDDRDAMLRHALVSAHLLLGIEGGRFISLIEPPEAAASVVAGCENRHTWPALAGDRDRRDRLISSPIILYDYPAVAKESPGDLCDGTEIDEILSLRIMTLTDDEKRQARDTDPRAQRIIDRVDAMTAETMAGLHGTIRNDEFFNPPGSDQPGQDGVVIAGIRVGRGSHVILRPSRRADAMDMFLRGQAATVAGVYRDLEDRVHVAVTVDSDPAAAMHESFGRFFYFDPTEIEPLGSTQREEQV